MDCDDAVDAALATLSADHPAIAAITFGYGPCFGPDPNAAYDCAVQVFGTVTIEFRDGGVEPVVVQVQHDGQGVVPKDGA
jgi:hypothetical protein